MPTQPNIFPRLPHGAQATSDIYDKLAQLSAQINRTVTPTPVPVIPVVPVTPATPSGGGGSTPAVPTFSYVPLLQSLPSNNPGQGAPYAVDGTLVDVGGVIYRYAGAAPFTGATPTYQWQAVGVSETTIAEAEWLTGVAGTNTITGSTAIAYSALQPGFKAILVPAHTNTAATTLNVNSIGASPVTKNGTTALVGGELVAGTVYLVIQDASGNWQILGIISPISAALLASNANGIPIAAPLNSTQIYVGNVLNLPQAQMVGGDATLSAIGNLTLATVNASPGTYTNATVVVNAKGLATSVSSGSGSATPSGPAGGDLSGSYPNPTVAQASGDFPVSGNIEAITVGKGLQIKAGTNARVGTGTLVGGTLLVGNTSVDAGTLIFLSDQGGGVAANIGSLYVSARVNGTSFTVSSVNPLDTSNFAYLLIESI